MELEEMNAEQLQVIMAQSVILLAMKWGLDSIEFKSMMRACIDTIDAIRADKDSAS